VPDGATDEELKEILADQLMGDPVGYTDLTRFEKTDQTFEEEE